MPLMGNGIKIAPSILAADFANLAEAVQGAESAGVVMIDRKEVTVR